MLLQFHSMLASPSSLTLEVSAMFFELCVHDGQAPVGRTMLSADSSCYNWDMALHGLSYQRVDSYISSLTAVD